MIWAAFIVTGGVSTAAAVCLGLIWWDWPSVGRRVGDWWAKGVAKGAQLVSALVGIAAGVASDGERRSG